jgi:hypothetical protein
MLSRLRHWLMLDSSSAVDIFSVTCACGHFLTGQRSENALKLPCPACGGTIFVLPKSPWRRLARRLPRALPPGAVPPRPRKLTRRDLLLPVAASALALALLVLAYRLWIMPLLIGGRDALTERLPAPAAIVERLERGRRLLDEGSFRLAAAEAEADPRPEDLPTLTGDQRRAWRQLRRQAAVLADLVSEPLEDILRHGAGVRSAEWHAEFRHRYLGKSIVLDAEFRKPPGGQWEVSYPLFLGQDRARIVVEDLRILQQLPSTEAQRLVVGVRLASVQLDAPGPTWVVRFGADSGVFLTEPAAAARVCRALAEPDALAVLERQKQWVD